MADPLPVVVRKADFIREFEHLAPHRHRYEVFRDFVHLSAFALVQAWPYTKSDAIEAEFAAIKARYSADEFMSFTRLLAMLQELLEPEPRDILGQLYMALDLGNTNTGQFFTPPEVSELMARMLVPSEGDLLGGKPFVTLSEPACGAGGMVLAFVKIMIEMKLNPMQCVWVHAQDVDRTAALMCYIQLSLWGVPAAVVVGNTLMGESREVFYTIGHHLGGWKWKLSEREPREQASMATTDSTPNATSEAVETTSAPPAESMTFVPVATSNQAQIGFDF
jgi:N-6 DNA Methylase